MGEGVQSARWRVKDTLVCALLGVLVAVTMADAWIRSRDRYELVATEGGYYRLDRWSGEVLICGLQVGCFVAPTKTTKPWLVQQ